ncbi:hypothetical protein [Paraburkholderia youngii]|uniref:hypothetical protein n=1 Tax=Paraburkholderia youngii TaxID=2782701 RepID=UPI001590DAE8|nr:hypothetical protein [Paraburkholderia youngii]NUX58657.1 hypothetical protein [Paraburkholderia youngii]
MTTQVSLAQTDRVIRDPQTQRAMLQMLQSIQADLAALRAWAAAHQHSALNAAPTTTPPALNTLP